MVEGTSSVTNGRGMLASRKPGITARATVAGVTAARLLTKAGHRVVVLEARDRVGGRVWTDRSDGYVTDRGASWIHGIDDSPVAAAATAFGMRMIEFTVGGYQPDSRPIAHYGPDGRRLTDAEAAAYVADIHAVDAELDAVIAASDVTASYRDVTDEASLQQVRAYKKEQKAAAKAAAADKS